MQALLYICILAHIVLTTVRAVTYNPRVTGHPTLKTDKFEEYLGNVLTSYALVDSARVISKRSLGEQMETVEFAAFNRTFHLVLVPTRSQSVSSTMSVATAGGESSAAVPVDIHGAGLLTGLYTGYVNGDPDSRLSGYFANNRQLVCTVHTGRGSDMLNIEPMSLLTGNTSETRLLVYYESGLRDSPADSPNSQPPATCGFRDSDVVTTNRQPLRRQRRQAPSSTSPSVPPATPKAAATATDLVCQLQVVADHAYHSRMGAGQLGATVRSIVKIVDDVNEIFRQTAFAGPASGATLPFVGFELASIVVMTDWSATAPTHFNAPFKEATVFTSAKVLEAFSDYKQNGINFTGHCLNHLLTFKRMQRNVLGLAYFQAACQSGGYQSRSERSGLIAMNSGLTTHSDVSGYPLLFRRAALVTAHELAHNIGSKHDPERLECRPDHLHGGAFIMYEKSVVGFSPNHNKFSPCSVNEMSDALESYLRGCLRPPSPRLCGNHRVDSGEECDAGHAGDACCRGDCRLRAGAVCSTANSPCCLECKAAPNSTVCLGESLLRPCRRPVLCDGVSFRCQQSPTPPTPPPPVADGTQCSVGRCLRGDCVSACHPAAPCDCPEADSACLLCCEGADGCSPASTAGGVRIALPAGAVCLAGGGRCQGNGTCSTTVNGYSGRLLGRLFQGLGSGLGGNSIATNNIVFIVLLSCLLVYVPACLLVSYSDHQRARAAEGDDQFDEHQSVINAA